MSEICLHPDRLLSLLDEIGRHRALSDEETDLIEAIVCRGHRTAGLRTRWTPKLDRALLRAASQRGGIRAFADKNQMSPMAAHRRLTKLRDGKRTDRQGVE